MNKEEKEEFEKFLKEENGNETLSYVEDSLVAKAFEAGLKFGRKNGR